MLFSAVSHGLSFELGPNDGDVVGQIQTVVSSGGERLSDIAQKYDVGNYEMRLANKHIKPNKPIKKGETIRVPTLFVLPNVAREGIVINQAELRLYYFPKDRAVVETYPVGVAKSRIRLPIKDTFITKKIKDPIWRPTANIKARARRKGIIWPDEVLPGPKNPLGKYALYLEFPLHLIHGTSNQTTVGKRISFGCIRLYKNDIKEIYFGVPVNTRVQLINQPFKFGKRGNDLFFEAHRVYKDRSGKIHTVEEAANKIKDYLKGKNAIVNWNFVLKPKVDGVPRKIGRLIDSI